MVSPQVVRRWIVTGSVVAITATGAVYGAQLKGAQELKKVCSFSRARHLTLCVRGLLLLLADNALQEKKRVLEATPEEMISQLETVRAEWVVKRNEIERKIATFAERRKTEKQDQGGQR
jgi:hypothetical protein